MIVTPVETEDHWTCLARRGMLLSETESIEFWRLAPGDQMSFGQAHGVDEMIILLTGQLRFDGKVLKAGSVIMVPDGATNALSAMVHSTLISARALPDRIAQRLPPRIPELPVHERVF